MGKASWRTPIGLSLIRTTALLPPLKDVARNCLISLPNGEHHMRPDMSLCFSQRTASHVLDLVPCFRPLLTPIQSR